MTSRPAQQALGNAAPASRRYALPASRKLGVFAAVVLGLGALVFGMQLSADVTPFVLVAIPAVAAVAAGWASGGRREVRALLGRLFVWRVSARWYLVALVVGLIFLSLHVPLYLPGQLYYGLPLWPLPFILLASSVLLTWIYIRTSSVLLAGLMHAAFNASVPLTWGLDPAWVWQARAITLTILAVAVLVSGQFRITGHPTNQSPRRGLRS